MSRPSSLRDPVLRRGIRLLGRAISEQRGIFSLALAASALFGGMTVAKLRAGLPAAKLPKGAFGSNTSTIEVANIDHAIALVDIAADPYYQPRFEKTSRRVAQFRRVG